MTNPSPPHRARDISPAYQLRYAWIGWPTYGQKLPPEPSADLFDRYASSLEPDGIRLLERSWTTTRIELIGSVKPEISPVNFAQRIKGRLTYELRTADIDAALKTKPTVRCIGEPRRKNVETYITNQVADRRYVSPTFARKLNAFTLSRDAVDLSKPRRTRSGTYWYALHLVLVVDGEWRVTDSEQLGRIRDVCLATADKHDHRLRELSVLPDHLHVAVAPPPTLAPLDVGMSYLNNLCHASRTGLWQRSFYLGAFGEYDMDAVRF